MVNEYGSVGSYDAATGSISYSPGSAAADYADSNLSTGATIFIADAVRDAQGNIISLPSYEAPKSPLSSGGLTPQQAYDIQLAAWKTQQDQLLAAIKKQNDDAAALAQAQIDAAKAEAEAAQQAKADAEAKAAAQAKAAAESAANQPQSADWFIAKTGYPAQTVLAVFGVILAIPVFFNALKGGK